MEDMLDDESGETAEHEQKEKAETPTEYNRDNVCFWHHWITGAKKAASRHWDDSSAAYKEYENEADLAERNNQQQEFKSPFCIYWSTSKTLESEYYSRNPIGKADRRFGIDDPIANTQSLIIERLAAYLDDGLMSSMRAAVSDVIHADKATTQLIYKASKYIDPETGQERVKNQSITTGPVCFDEILHTPEAKSQDEITEMAYYFCMDYAEAEDRFNPDGSKNLPYKNSKTYERGKDDEDRTDIPGKYLEGWECWSKITNKVYFVSENYKEDFLDQKPDPYGLKGLFPSPPFVISSKPRKSMYPTPVFIHLYPTIKTLHELRNRIIDLIPAVERVAIIDGSYPELLALCNDIRRRGYIAVPSLSTLLEKGGIENLIHYLPVKEFIDSIATASQLEDKFKTDIDEWMGVPDILRGQSDPSETAQAQEIKTSSAHGRFRNVKNDIAELARASIEMKIDLALKVFDDSKIASITGYQYMKPEHKQNFLPALSGLRSDEERIIRLAIETDSTSYVNEQVEIQKAKARAEIVIPGLGVIANMENMEFATIALEVLLESVAAVGGSKQYEEGIKRSVQKLVEKRKEPAPPPPPDPAQLSAQTAQMKASEDVKLAREKQQTDTQLAITRERFEQGFKIEQLNLQRQVAQSDYEIKAQQILIAGEKVRSDQEQKATATELNAYKQAFEQDLNLRVMDLEEFKVVSGQEEKLMEEHRLAKEQDIEVAKMGHQKELATVDAIANIASQPEQAPSESPINIHLNGK